MTRARRAAGPPPERRVALVSRLAGALASVLSAGCADLPEPSIQTDKIEIATDFPSRICAGTVADLDEQVRRVERTLDQRMAPGERVRLYWLTDGVQPYCRDGVTGCFYPGTRVAFATRTTAEHEIVHAVLNAPVEANRFLEEGLAEALSGPGSVLNPRTTSRPPPADMIWVDAGDARRDRLDYVVASHFTSYVAWRYGEDLLRPLARALRDGADRAVIEGLFAEHAERLEDVYDAFESWAPTYYPGPGADVIGSLPATSTGVARVELDCDDARTRGPLPAEVHGMYRVFRIDVPAAGTYELTTARPGAAPARPARLDDGPWIELHRESIARPLDFLAPVGPATEVVRFETGQTASFQLAAATYVIVVGSDSVDAAVTVDVRLRRVRGTDDDSTG